MLIEKGDLLKVLRVVSGFDNSACAFLGVQLPKDGKPQFHRSSAHGFIQTKDFDLNQLGSSVFASLANLKDLLNASADTMEMVADVTGQLRLASLDEFPIRLQVFTVRKQAAGVKEHVLGNPNFIRYSGDIFKGLDIRPFKPLEFPTLLDGRLLVNTISGTLVWTGPDALKSVRLQPRESFLRFISGGSIGEFLVSQQGYWIAEKDGLMCALYGHNTPTELLTLHTLPGTELTRFDASRLVSSLSLVSSLTSDTDKVEINPKEGIVCRDKYTNPQIFPSGATTTTWPKATIFGRTVKFIVDALSQTNEDEVVLYSVPLRNPTYRIARGPFEVNFGLV